MKSYLFFIFLFLYSCSEKKSSDKIIKNNLYEKAWSHFDKGDYMDAFIYFGQAKDYFLKQKDNLGAAKCLMNMAIIQEQMGDEFGSQETAINALKFFNEKELAHLEYLATNYNTLGITSSKLKNYPKAISFYQKAIGISDNQNDKIAFQNNLANNYRKEKKFKSAIKIFSSILMISEGDKNYSRILSNLAYTKWLQNPNYNPIPEFQKALNIRLKEKDNWGLNASYSHLTDYYTKTQPDSALFYATKMYDISIKIKSPDDQIEALQKLIILDPKNYSSHFNRYQFLTDSLQTVRNKAKNQFALIRYETEKNKADFLKAKAESTERQNKIIVRNIILIALMTFLIFLYFYYRRRQKRLQQEKLLEVKNTELRYSKKVHDKVANRIYQLMSQVENREVIDKDALLFGLENAYETSRDISYDNRDINENQNFSEQLHKMLDSYSSDSIKVIFNGNNEKLWEGISFQNKTEVYLILQELMTNMKKHSQANIVSIKFSRENSNINISYTDNGIGIKNFSPKKGLQNAENRIIAMKGTINFDTGTNNLLKINLSFPV